MSLPGLTGEQITVVNHPLANFVEACPGAGKTRTIVARVQRIARDLPSRRGIAVLSFTNSAVDEFKRKCKELNLGSILGFPSFVGTFDGFVRHFLLAPGGIEGVDISPTVVDSWASLGIEVRLSGAQAFHGPGVKLDSFDPESNRVMIDSISDSRLRRHVQQNEGAYNLAATRYRSNLRARGYLSAGDTRVEVLRKLQDPRWSRALGQAIASRFIELIVDEAQDCNPQDLKILKWLQDSQLIVTVVADPDQAIYGFRHGDPANLQEFRGFYSAGNQLSLTGNFRSSSPICSMAATLRQRLEPDISVGVTKEILFPVQVLSYRGYVSETLMRTFTQRLSYFALPLTDSIVLAHKRGVARRASGNGTDVSETNQSRVQKVAKAVSELTLVGSKGREREASLRSAEEVLLSMMGKIELGETPTRAAQRHGIDLRWLRRVSLEFCLRLPNTCPDDDVGRQNWIEVLRAEASRLALPCPEGFSVARFFASPRSQNWSEFLRSTQLSGLRHSTIHEAKGQEFDSVLLVIPPDSGSINRTRDLFSSWVNRTDSEAKRVIYVGVTRARRLLGIAIPKQYLSVLQNFLRASFIPPEYHDC